MNLYKRGIKLFKKENKALKSNLTLHLVAPKRTIYLTTA
ncbi:hypothetical protein ATE90_1553 [Polaribacter sp. Hel1_33_96]|jgi:hypothetical protein|nr:hypothetical protein ATE90_1553 [Polaribacter sp. Hel1_33_96]